MGLTPIVCPACGVAMPYPGYHNEGHPDAIDVVAYPEQWLHLHGKAISGLRHSHPLRDGKRRHAPDHDHEGPRDQRDPRDPRGVGRAIYYRREEP